MKLESSLYWKCQLIGWGIVAFTTGVINVIINPGASGFLLRAIITGLFGLTFTNFLRFLIKRLKIFTKKFVIQIIYLLALVLLVCFIANSVFIITLYATGILSKNIPPNQPPVNYVHVFLIWYYQEVTMVLGWTAIYFLVQYIRNIKIVEREKAALKIQLIEAEAQALRAQMNPHFIFNCLNSIKSLIQRHEEEKSITYLITFSKLIRTLFNNADKKEITLHDELDTCRLYLQLESMRFDASFSYSLHIDSTIDLKSIRVPALIIQPFIENAIWHGIIPSETGGHISLDVFKENEAVEIVIDDNGIGREIAMNYKSVINPLHHSKGVNLTQSRLELDSLLKQRKARLEIIDKKDENRNATGTKVVISINEEI